MLRTSPASKMILPLATRPSCTGGNLLCSVVAQYDNDDGDGNMIKIDIDDMIMVVLKKMMKAFKSITKMMNKSF